MEGCILREESLEFVVDRLDEKLALDVLDCKLVFPAGTLYAFSKKQGLCLWSKKTKEEGTEN